MNLIKKLFVSVSGLTITAGQAFAGMSGVIPIVNGSDEVVNGGKDVMDWFELTVQKGLFFLVMAGAVVGVMFSFKTIQNGVQRARMNDGTIGDAVPMLILGLMEATFSMGLFYLAANINGYGG